MLMSSWTTTSPLLADRPREVVHVCRPRFLSLLILLAFAGATRAASRAGGLQAKYLDTTRQLLSSQLAVSPPPYYSGGASLARRSLQAPAYYPPTLQRRALAGLSDIDEQSADASTQWLESVRRRLLEDGWEDKHVASKNQQASSAHGSAFLSAAAARNLLQDSPPNYPPTYPPPGTQARRSLSSLNPARTGDDASDVGGNLPLRRLSQSNSSPPSYPASYPPSASSGGGRRLATLRNLLMSDGFAQETSEDSGKLEGIRVSALWDEEGGIGRGQVIHRRMQAFSPPNYVASYPPSAGPAASLGSSEQGSPIDHQKNRLLARRSALRRAILARSLQDTMTPPPYYGSP